MKLPYVADISTPLKVDITKEVSEETLLLGSILNDMQKLYLEVQITALLTQMLDIECTSTVDAKAHADLIGLRAQIRLLKWLLTQSSISELAQAEKNN